MKNTYILLLVSAAFFAADSLHSADKYFGDTSAVFTSNTAVFGRGENGANNAPDERRGYRYIL